VPERFRSERNPSTLTFIILYIVLVGDMGVRVQKAAERGKTEEDWLISWHSFSFNQYYDPKNMGFHKLRVFNDDTIGAGTGFETHAHADMEIVTIVIDGVLQHKDSTGSSGKLLPGMVQVMSAGTGVHHSEFNGSKSKELKLFQVWIMTDKRGHQPRYAEKKISWGTNELKLAVSGKGDGLTINQDAQFYLADFNTTIKKNIKIKPGKGHFLFVVDGNAVVAKQELFARDAAMIDNIESYAVEFKKGTKIMLIEC